MTRPRHCLVPVTEPQGLYVCVGAVLLQQQPLAVTGGHQDPGWRPPGPRPRPAPAPAAAGGGAAHGGQAAHQHPQPREAETRGDDGGPEQPQLHAAEPLVPEADRGDDEAGGGEQEAGVEEDVGYCAALGQLAGRDVECLGGRLPGYPVRG